VALAAMLGLISLAAPHQAGAQYFGRNKVQYKTFDFQVLKTEHFDVYYYSQEKDVAQDAARMAERWYARLSKILDHQLDRRQPLILYASHPDFEQTNAISGELGEGTGGVTEYLKRRIVLPLAGPYSETDHVIGHELVHAFQYDIAGQGKSGASFEAPALMRLPLWFIEGMAEYLSLGPVDPHTAMWMRDAAESNKLPTLKSLSDPRYFPYRYGQALWAYVGGRWGDESIGRILKAAARSGDAEGALRLAVGETGDTLSHDWHAAIRAWYGPLTSQTESPESIGRVLIKSKEEGGSLNLGPALSPDGRTLAFLSERSLFAIDLFIADAQTGQVHRQITSTAVDPHFQSIQFISSSGAFSPNGRELALGTIVRGNATLTVVDVATGHRTREITCRDLGEIYTPTWSPDGREIAFSALVGGVSDLFVVDVKSGARRRLTSDAFADLEPSWSPDGKSIAFVTDRFTSDLTKLQYGQLRLAIMDPFGGHLREVKGFPTGKHIDPQWTPDGNALYFVSDHNGISDIYRVDVASGEITQLTNLTTGVTGITALSPALASAKKTPELVFSVYRHGRYDLIRVDDPAALAGRPPKPAFTGVKPATMPPEREETATVTEMVSNPTLGLADPSSFKNTRYRPSLSLDYVAQPTVGVAYGNGQVGAAGGVGLVWSDMLGNHNLVTMLQSVNGGGAFFDNIAAELDYYNLTHRWNWGATLSQIPYVTRDFVEDQGIYQGTPAVRQRDFRYRQIERDVQGLAIYPYSRVTRIEFSGGYSAIDFSSEVETRIYDANTGELLVDQTTPLPGDTLSTLSLPHGGVALVHDTSIMGGTSPLLGSRWRLEADAVGGSLHFYNLLADYRQYVPIVRPLTLAGRIFHNGRYGSDSESNRLSPLFIGYPSMVRGYDSGSFSAAECGNDSVNCPAFDRLLGTKIAVANLELRLPLLGPLGAIPSNMLPPIEAAVFYDMGSAWYQGQGVHFSGPAKNVVTSKGVALRVNLLGFAVAEIDYVHPDDRPLKNWYWMFSFQPGF
jgi:hypothetical protein